MAVRIKGSVMGDFKGKVGDAVMVAYKGMFVIKSKPVSYRCSANVKKQGSSKAIFKSVMEFLNSVGSDVFHIGFQLPKKSRMTALNAATSYHLLHALEGEFPDYRIDLTKVKFSRPLLSLENGYQAVVENGEKFYVALRWGLNPFPAKSTQLDDKAVIVTYNTNRNNFDVSEDHPRRDALGFELLRNLGKAGDELYIWLFFISDDKKRVSETQYLGTITLIA